MHPVDLTEPASQFAALAASAPDAIFTIDEASTILFANAAAERVFGYTPDELIGRPLADLIPERLRGRHDAGLARYLRTGRRHIPWTGVQLPGLTKSGEEIPLEISFGEFVDATGRHVFSGFMRDMTERVRHERELLDARAVAESALGELSAVNRVMDIALASGTYELMMHELLQGVQREIQPDAAAVLLLDDAGEALVPEIGIGITIDRALRVPIDRGLAARIVASRKPIAVDDLRTETVADPAVRSEIASLLAVPIHSGDSLIGVLYVGSRARRTFSGSEVRLVGIVATRLAGVLSRVRQFNAEQRARADAESSRRALATKEHELRRVNEELERRAGEERTLRTVAQAISGAREVSEVMRHVADGVLALTGAAGAFVEQVSQADQEVEVVAASGTSTPQVGQRVPFPGSLTEEIITRREAVFLVGMEGLGAAMAPYLDASCHGCSALVVPLFAEQQILGALIVLRQPDEPPFDRYVLDRVRIMADVASLSLQRLVALAESEQRRGEAESAVRSRDDVLSVVSHDLRNPVSTVVMAASLLSDTGLTLGPEDARKQLDIISRSAQRMNRLIQDLLDVARIQGGRMTVTCRCEDAGSIAKEAADSFIQLARTKSLTLHCDFAAPLPHIHVDRDRVLQVLSNYLNNALKFSPPGGSIILRVRLAGPEVVRFEVEDHGPGIAPEDIPHLFDRFWQAKRTAHLGSGLGLTISRGIVDAHKGRTWVESAPGNGSTFFVDIPVSRQCAHVS